MSVQILAHWYRSLLSRASLRATALTGDTHD